MNFVEYVRECQLDDKTKKNTILFLNPFRLCSEEPDVSMDLISSFRPPREAMKIEFIKVTTS